MNKTAENKETSEVTKSYSGQFSEMMGIRLDVCDGGICKFDVEIREFQKQQRGFVHGGILSALIDHCGGTAAASTLGPDEYVLTSDMNISYLRPALPPKIILEGQVIKRGKTLIVSEVKVYNSDASRTLCTVGRVTLPVIKKGK